MKALTLHQPWASLIALGIKTIETRSWATQYRGPLAIHAGVKRPSIRWSHYGEGLPAYMNCVPLERYYNIEEASNVAGDFAHIWTGPLGAIVATCELVDCLPMQMTGDTVEEPCLEIGPRGYPRLRLVDPWTEDLVGGELVWRTRDMSHQAPYGDFTRGRYAWLLADIKPVDPPVPAKGKHGLWEWSEEGERKVEQPEAVA